MKKILSATPILLSGLSFSFAQQAPQKTDFNFTNFAQLQTLPKHTRDSLIHEFKNNGKTINNVTRSAAFKGHDPSGEFASVTKIFYKSMMELAVAVLENPEPVLTAKNQAKLNRLQSKLEYDMNLISEKISYENERKGIIDEYRNGQYNDAKEKRDARKEMDDSLKELEKDYKSKLKDLVQERKERMKEDISDEA
ncbi:hypothetical protein [Mucilaginibacter lappiensis]|uniref:Uncharacterized protein n=1 Tax=Mucilaginibacter lappiensis TaxID=354630 RepID=A0A841J938_9SPHI|nr:hypothetical protein [Mucilaginibacter lappiensis]MBB6127234.1 hypothetical protein [Mucilaginibacter lappiensis]